MTRSRFVALPLANVASSRLAWRTARAILSREQGWSLDALSVSRLWRFQVGRSRWTARAYISFFFHAWAQRRRGIAVFAIYFEGTGSASALQSSALVQDLHDRLGAHRTSAARAKFSWTLPNESRPRRLLAEMDLIAEAFGSSDRHRAPPSPSRTPSKQLAAVAETVLAHGTWSLETPSLWLLRQDVCGAISPMPSSGRGELSSMLFIPNGKAQAAVTACVGRAESHGYVDTAGKGDADLAFWKLQPLSLRAGLTEARFLEAEVSRDASGDRAR